ncbi:PepSY-associated TM helix domain-containing protein [Nocardiopsis alba]|uniref:PepSY-associated TM helix domain-containing protein n=1 Tax=Nocardiopsis alba TaxID=53437 RepID=UPI00034C14F5|nr:PepSY domain-containing protein [Nocardiopsis alba]
MVEIEEEEDRVETTDERAGGPPSPDRERRRGVWAALRPLILRAHFYAGVLIAPFVLVAAVSGLLYVWTPQVERALYDDLLRVPASEHSLSLSEQVRLAEDEVPGARATSVRPATGPEDSTRVLLDRSVEGVPYREGPQTAVFVDPHRGEVLGISESYGTSGALPARTWIDLLHRELHLGEVGRLYSELAASWLAPVALGGCLLWLARARRRGARRTLLPWSGRGEGSARSRTVSAHATVGVWLLVGLLFLSATGLTWSKYAGANVTDLRAALSWTTPTVATGPSSDSPGVDAGIDRVMDRARDAGLDGPVAVDLPRDHVSPYVVTQIERSWPTKADSAALAQDTGEVVDVVRFADHPFMAKLSRWGVDAHMGVLFGIPNQIALTALCLGLVYVIAMGYRSWWLRRPDRERMAGVGRPHPRGSFLALSPPLKTAVVVFLAALGWAMPVLGVSLAVFLLVDTVIGLRAGDLSGGRRAPRRPRPRSDLRSSPAPERPARPRSDSRNRG